MSMKSLEQFMQYLSKTTLLDQMQAQHSQFEPLTFYTILNKLKNRQYLKPEIEVRLQLEMLFETLLKVSDRPDVLDTIQFGLQRFNHQLRNMGFKQINPHQPQQNTQA